MQENENMTKSEELNWKRNDRELISALLFKPLGFKESVSRLMTSMEMARMT